jgi:hypothetical protein
MSTKTTFKRIALVAVAALGFGMLSAVPSSAAVTATYTSSLSTNASSFTIVGAAASTNYAILEISTTNDQGDAAVLFSGESITARVVSATAGAGVAASSIAKTDLEFDNATGVVATTGAALALAGSYAAAGTAASAKVVANVGTAGVDMSLRRSGTAADPAVANTYFVAVRAASSKTDLGSYVVRLEVRNAAGNITASTDVTVIPVVSALDSGAKLSVSTTAVQTAGAVLGMSSTSYVKVSVTDANGGLVRVGANGPATPTVTGLDAATAPASIGTLAADDKGSAGDYEATKGLDNDGVFGVGVAAAGVIAAGAATGSATITARYGAATPATGTVTINGATTAGYISTSVTAADKVVTGTTNYYVPLTTKTAVVTAYIATDATGATPKTGSTIYSTVTYSGAGCNTPDLSPTAGALTKGTTDASGLVSITVTNANPATTCAATVTFSGAVAVVTGSIATRTINWAASAATTSTASTSSYDALLLSTHKITWTVLDQFSAPVVGKTVTFTMSGANKPTAGVPSAVTDANGQVSYTWTDALGVVASTTLGTDAINVATVAGSATAASAVTTITYKAALAVVAGIVAYYDTTSAFTTKVVVPATNIGSTAGKAISGNDQIDQTKAITAQADPGAVALRFTPQVAALTTANAAMTIKISGAGMLISPSTGKLVDSYDTYGSQDIWAFGTKTGVATVTATSGTITKTALINFVNIAADARVLKLTESAGSYTASVSDFNGNAVGSVTVKVSLTGAGRLGNGASYAEFTTASDGTVSFDVVGGAASVTASLSSSTYAKTTWLAASGNATGSVVTTGAPAGVGSVTVVTEGNTVTATAAQTAADAAAEATDAANAATDAANAAAEAADAATAAAQDAADAVAALSAQVASLISGLKAQLTALTNLVIKIQKKVKA